jgi:hypothetical protein
VRWLDPDWRAEAERWIRGQVGEPAGAIEQPHVRWWSTVMRVPTATGDLWFKAAAPVDAFEPRLTVLLGDLFPERVPEVVAADLERGWMLMRDGGTRLRELVHGPADLGRWEELLPRYAELQLALAPRADELLDLGVPDLRLARIPDELARLLDDEPALLVGQEDGLTPDELARIRGAQGEVAELCGRLAAHGIGETLQHDDLHDGNVFVRDGRGLVFDWGDSCVSHPFHTLVVTLRSSAYRLGDEPGSPELVRLRDAYLQPFGPGIEDAFALAQRTGTLARALAWHRFLSAAEPGEREEDAGTVPYGLRRFLANGPLGAWQ